MYIYLYLCFSFTMTDGVSCIKRLNEKKNEKRMTRPFLKTSGFRGTVKFDFASLRLRYLVDDC